MTTPRPVTTSRPTYVTTPRPVTTSRPTYVTTPRPATTHRPAITTRPVTTSRPTYVTTSRPATTHRPATTPAPASSKNNYNIIIHQHINFIIQNFKYTQKHSYTHIENLLRNLKSITQNHDLYRNLLYTRHHLYNHYNTMFKELYRLLKEFDTNNHAPRDDNVDPFYPNDNNDAYDDGDDYGGNDDKDADKDPYYDDNNPYKDEDNDNGSHKMPPFVKSMKILDKHIQKIEKSIHFIKGKYKYTLLNILHKLKLQYHQDTIRLLHYWRNRFI